MPEKQECEEVARQAWQDTKDDGDPDWESANPLHRERLIYKAQSVERSGVADDAFEKRVAKLLAGPPPEPRALEPESKPKAAKKTKVVEKETVH